MTEEILKTLKDIEKDKDVKILYACESGSRAWGFSSPDSDFDVRFIYMRKSDKYLSVFHDYRDVIELPIDDLLDVNGWDLSKALNLLHKNNLALFEWLHSPVVYFDLGVQETLQQLVKQSFRKDRAHYHYLAMSNGIYEQHVKGKEKPGIKKLFYVLRTLCCCLWVERFSTMPPVEFQNFLTPDFLDQDLLDEIALLQAEKKVKNEKEAAENCSLVIKFIESEIPRLEELKPQKVEIERAATDEIFKKILTDFSF